MDSDAAASGKRPDIRVSDDERERTVELLSDSAAVGRLTLQELEERAAQAYRAVTTTDLERLTRDLPDRRAPSTPRGKARRWVVSVMGGGDLKGRFRVGDRLNAVAVMAGGDIDLRNAELSGEDVTIVAVALMGGIDIYVPDTVDVQVHGFALMGGNDQRGSGRDPRPGAPVVHVYAYALMGGIDVWRLPVETPGQRLRDAKRAAKALER